MLQSEFDRLTSRPYTEAEFSEIHYIYCYHPACLLYTSPSPRD